MAVWNPLVLESKDGWPESKGNTFNTSVAEPLASVSHVASATLPLVMSYLHQANKPLGEWSPVATDINNDGIIEILFGTAFSTGVGVTLKCITSGGTLLWTGVTEASGINCRDINDNGHKEIFVISTADNVRAYDSGGTQLWAFGGYFNPNQQLKTFLNSSGSWDLLFGCNYQNFYCRACADGAVRWTRSFGTGYGGGGEVIYDIDQDGTLDIIFNPRGFGDTGDLWRITEDNDKIYQNTINVDLPHCTPVLADINNDGTNEVILSLGNSGRVGAYDMVNNSQIWLTDAYGTQFYGCSAADIDGDGEIEILAPNWNGYLYVFNSSGSLKWSYNAASARALSVQIADMDGDGKGEIALICQSAFHILDSSGSLIISQASPTGGKYFTVEAALLDLYGDGFYELVLGNQDGYVRAYSIRLPSKGEEYTKSLYEELTLTDTTPTFFSFFWQKCYETLALQEDLTAEFYFHLFELLSMSDGVSLSNILTPLNFYESLSLTDTFWPTKPLKESLSVSDSIFQKTVKKIFSETLSLTPYLLAARWYRFYESMGLLPSDPSLSKIPILWQTGFESGTSIRWDSKGSEWSEDFIVTTDPHHGIYHLDIYAGIGSYPQKFINKSINISPPVAFKFSFKPVSVGAQIKPAFFQMFFGSYWLAVGLGAITQDIILNYDFGAASGGRILCSYTVGNWYTVEVFVEDYNHIYTWVNSQLVDSWTTNLGGRDATGIRTGLFQVVSSTTGGCQVRIDCISIALQHLWIAGENPPPERAAYETLSFLDKIAPAGWFIKKVLNENIFFAGATSFRFLFHLYDSLNLSDKILGFTWGKFLEETLSFQDRITKFSIFLHLFETLTLTGTPYKSLLPRIRKALNLLSYSIVVYLKKKVNSKYGIKVRERGGDC